MQTIIVRVEVLFSCASQFEALGGVIINRRSQWDLERFDPLNEWPPTTKYPKSNKRNMLWRLCWDGYFVITWWGWIHGRLQLWGRGRIQEFDSGMMQDPFSQSVVCSVIMLPTHSTLLNSLGTLIEVIKNKQKHILCMTEKENGASRVQPSCTMQWKYLFGTEVMYSYLYGTG